MGCRRLVCLFQAGVSSNAKLITNATRWIRTVAVAFALADVVYLLNVPVVVGKAPQPAVSKLLSFNSTTACKHAFRNQAATQYRFEAMPVSVLGHGIATTSILF